MDGVLCFRNTLETSLSLCLYSWRYVADKDKQHVDLVNLESNNP
jgi:hypothetical protein